MGLYDRDYIKHDYKSPPGGGGLNMPTLTPAVKILIMINVAVYFIDNMIGHQFFRHFALVNDPSYIWQLWRLVGYQFLHAGIGHILLNMLGLFFLGNTLERFWGTKKFLIFYISCGIVGGLFFFLFTALRFLGPSVLVGASGSVLGLLAACAILFPHFVVFIYFFPVPIRKAAIFMPIIYLMTILTGGHNSGGDAAHLGGMLAGAAYLLWPKYRHYLGFIPHPTVDFTTHLKHKASHEEIISTIEIDRILKKVHEQGLQSLTEGEKRSLRKATEQHQTKG